MGFLASASHTQAAVCVLTHLALFLPSSQASFQGILRSHWQIFPTTENSTFLRSSIYPKATTYASANTAEPEST